MNYRKLLMPLMYSISKTISVFQKGTGRVFILTFHSIPNHQIESFSRLISNLNDTIGFITPDQFTGFLSENYEIGNTKLLLSFDDGFYSNHIVAEQVLTEFNIKAIFFIATEFISCSNSDEMRNFVANNLHCPPDITETRAMSWEQISELVFDGHKIGSHTLSHRNLADINSSRILEDEIIQSKNTLEDKLCTPVEHFAYPFGNITSINSMILKKLCGVYKYIYSGVRGANSSTTPRGVIRREAVSLEHGQSYNRMIAEGALSMYYYLDRVQLDKML
jgi:peptidoglycan/xylan/chitin deacetylase (PgdA/CDA1 family)